MSMRTIILTSSLSCATLVGAYAFIIKRELASVDEYAITSSDSPPASFSSSSTVQSLINPRNNVCLKDTRAIRVVLPDRLRRSADDVILAQFVGGVFGGWVFGPERSILKLLRMRLVHFPDRSRKEDTTKTSDLWSVADSTFQSLPPPGSILFGAFQVVDVDLQQHRPLLSTRPSPPSERAQSHIDIAFGSSWGSFAGVHRFSILRDPVVKPGDNPANAGAGEGDGDGGDEVEVTIEFASLSCNPQMNRPLKTSFLHTFHKWYAMLLFREGVARVLRKKPIHWV